MQAAGVISTSAGRVLVCVMAVSIVSVNELSLTVQVADRRLVRPLLRAPHNLPFTSVVMLRVSCTSLTSARVWTLTTHTRWTSCGRTFYMSTPSSAVLVSPR